jgi:hypothetical protein
VSQPLPLDGAIQALKRDPTHPVRVREGETGAELDALFADVRQCSNRQVPDLP